MGRNNSSARRLARQQTAQQRSSPPPAYPAVRLVQQPCHLVLGECRIHNVPTGVSGREWCVTGWWKDSEGRLTVPIEVYAFTPKEAQGYFDWLAQCDYTADLRLVTAEELVTII